MNTTEQAPVATVEDPKETATNVAVAVDAPAPAANRITLSPQDRTRVLGAIAFHVNGYSVPKDNGGSIKLFDRLHSEQLLDHLFKYNTPIINKLGPLPEFSFFRQINDNVIGKEVSILLINGLIVKGFIGVNGYIGEIFNSNLPVGPVEGTETTNVRPRPAIFVQMTKGDTTVVEELSFYTLIAVNDRLPLEAIPAVDVDFYQSVTVPIIDDTNRNKEIIAKHRAEVAKRKEHDILQEARRKKNAAERKARRKNRK